MTAPGDWPFVHQIEVRYHECDMQGVVFNAHYLAYCDLAVGAWLRTTLGWTGSAGDGFDWMLVRAELDWRSPATFGDVLAVGVGIERFGTTSFVVRFEGRVGDRVAYEARITYVCVAPGSSAPIAVSDAMRAGLGPAPGGGG